MSEYGSLKTILECFRLKLLLLELIFAQSRIAGPTPPDTKLDEAHDSVGTITTHELAPSAYRNDGQPKGTYAYGTCEERRLKAAS